MRNVLGPRREIGIRTFFNILGPIANPAGVKHQLIGVYDPAIALLIARVLHDLGISRAMVVNGEGMDELTNLGKTRVVELIEGETREYEISPQMFGIDVAEPEDIRGGNPVENARAALSILKGEKSPRTDVVALNSAAALYISGRSSSLHEGLELAGETILSGRALAKLREFSAFAHDMEKEKQLERNVSELHDRRIVPDVLRRRCPELCGNLVKQVSELDGGTRALENLDSHLFATPSALSVLVLSRLRRVLHDGLIQTNLTNRTSLRLSDVISSSSGVSIIAEFKTTYPSAPPLHLSPDPIRAAEVYSAAGVAGVSVLVEQDFFGGSPELFSILRSRLSLPMLFKDFVAIEMQIEVAKRLGADAVLLIAKALRPEALGALIGACVANGMEPLVELHDIVDLEKLSSCGCEDSVRLVGINRRDLRTLGVSKGELGELRGLVDADKIVIAESGVEYPRDILALHGFDAVLIGSMFMRAEDLEKTVLETVSMGRSVRR
jgi:indole-3-glycerol phosphate synthase